MEFLKSRSVKAIGPDDSRVCRTCYQSFKETSNKGTKSLGSIIFEVPEDRVLINSQDLKMEEELGRGEFGVVNLELCRGAKVAVKQLRIDQAAFNFESERNQKQKEFCGENVD